MCRSRGPLFRKRYYPSRLCASQGSSLPISCRVLIEVFGICPTNPCQEQHSSPDRRKSCPVPGKRGICGYQSSSRLYGHWWMACRFLFLLSIYLLSERKYGKSGTGCLQGVGSCRCGIYWKVHGIYSRRRGTKSFWWQSSPGVSEWKLSSLFSYVWNPVETHADNRNMVTGRKPNLDARLRKRGSGHSKS